MKTIRFLLVLPVLICLPGCSERDRITSEAERVRNELQRELQGIRIERGTAPTLEGEPVVVDYTLTLDSKPIAKPYLFDKYKYKIITGGDVEKIPTRSICNIIDQRFDERVRTLEALRQVEGEISFGGRVTISAKSTAAPLVDAVYTVKKMAAIKGTRVLVAIRGYADGQHGAWSRPLEKFPYNYETIRVMPPTDPDTENPLSYFLREEEIHIPGGEYDNSLLPDLRAEFIKRVLIIPALQKCKTFRVDVKILKGFEYPTPDQPQERKVQVFLYLFEDESELS
jgi:hypothetical protein